MPAWAAQDLTCPHGYTTGLPFSGFTVPKDHATTLNHIGGIYASAPFFLAIGFPLLFLWTRGTKEILGVVFFWLAALVVEILKVIIRQPRPPESCHTSCGMPSGHTLESMAFFTWFLLEVLRSKVWVPRPLGKAVLLLIAGVLLLPVGWSRTATHDHSWPQVVIGGAVGVLLGIGWFMFLQLRLMYWFLKMLCANITFLVRNYPPDGVEEEEPWAIHGSGVEPERGAVSHYGASKESFPKGD